MARCPIINQPLSYGEELVQAGRWLSQSPATRYKSPLNEAGGHGESAGFRGAVLFGLVGNRAVVGAGGKELRRGSSVCMAWLRAPHCNGASLGSGEDMPWRGYSAFLLLAGPALAAQRIASRMCCRPNLVSSERTSWPSSV